MALTAQQLTSLAARIRAPDGHTTFGLLDGAAIPGLLDRLYGTPDLEFECLFAGDPAVELAEVAPYIVRIEQNSEFAAWALGGWGQRRGFFVQAPTAVGIAPLRRHFRKLNTVYGPASQPLLFRYYDPRAIRMFLSDAGPREITHIFGPASRFMIERASGATGVALSSTAGELIEEVFSIT